MLKRQRLAKDAAEHAVAVARYWAEIVLQPHAPVPATPRYKPLTQQQAQRLQRVCELLTHTQTTPVSSQSMRAVLTPDEYATYRSQLTAPQSHFDMVRAQGRPDVLNDYIAKLKTADFTNARATAAGSTVRGEQNIAMLQSRRT